MKYFKSRNLQLMLTSAGRCCFPQMNSYNLPAVQGNAQAGPRGTAGMPSAQGTLQLGNEGAGTAGIRQSYTAYCKTQCKAGT